MWKGLHGNQRNRPVEWADPFLHLQPDQRPHSSVGHYNSQTKTVHHLDPVTNSKEDVSLDEQQSPPDTVRQDVPATTSPSEAKDASPVTTSRVSEDPAQPDEEVTIRSPSRKVSQERPRLDKSQSTPAYESAVGDVNSFEEKLRDIRLRKQSRVEEEGAVVAETVSANSSPGPATSKNRFLIESNLTKLNRTNPVVRYSLYTS